MAERTQQLRTLLDALKARLDQSPEAPFLVGPTRSWTFAEANAAADIVAGQLAGHGVGVGDRVALYLQNDPHFVVAQLAAWKLGAIAVSVNPMWLRDELTYVLSDSEAVALVALGQLHRDVASKALADTKVRIVLLTEPEGDLVPPPAPNGNGGTQIAPDGIAVERFGDGTPNAKSFWHHADSDDIATLGYTSGTSGRPKGVPNSHAAILHSAGVYRELTKIGADDVFLAGAPLFHITGLTAGVGLSLLTGMRMVLFHRFDPAVALRMIAAHRCTFTVMAITAYRAMLDHPDAASTDLSSLAKAYSGGAPVSAAMSERWQALTGVPIHNVYGLTETTGPILSHPLGVVAPIDEQSGSISVGQAVSGAEIKLVDPGGESVCGGAMGEILVKGPMVVSGYWNNPRATAEGFAAGFLRTGDVGWRTEDDWYFVVDRVKDMINASGFKVAPREVEEILCTHPAVAEVAVVGWPDEYRGETVKAFVVARAGTAPTEAQLIAHCRERMAAYKYPRSVEFVAELPKTASGKILRRELRS